MRAGRGRALHHHEGFCLSKVELPDSLSTAAWEKQKKELGKDKTVLAKVQSESNKLSEAIKALEKAHGAIDFALLDAKGHANAAAANTALARLDAAIKSELKNVITAARTAATVADTFQAAADKLRKSLKGDGEKAATAAMNAASAASKASARFVADLNGAVTSARSDVEAECAKLKAGAGKRAVPAANPKAAADAKVVATLMKKTISVLRSPKGSPVPVRFMMLRLDKKLRIYIGPKPDNG